MTKNSIIRKSKCSYKKSYKKRNLALSALLFVIVTCFMSLPTKSAYAVYDPHLDIIDREDTVYDLDLDIDDYARIRKTRGDTLHFKNNNHVEYLIDEIKKEITFWIIRFRASYYHSYDKRVMLKSNIRHYALNILASGKGRSLLDCIHILFTDKKKAEANYKYFINKMQALLVYTARNDFKKLLALVMELGAMVKAHNINPINEWFIALCEALPSQIMILKLRLGIADLRKQIGRVRDLDEDIFINGKRVKIKEWEEKSLAYELALLFAPTIRKELERNSASEEQIMKCMDNIIWSIRGFVFSFAQGDYINAVNSLNKFKTIASDNGIEDIGKKYVAYLKSFPSVSQRIKSK